MAKILDFLALIGKLYLQLATIVGKSFLFIKSLIYYIFFKRFFFKNFLESVLKFGYCSIPIVSITALFTGAVLGLQLHSVLIKFGVQELIPNIVLISMIKELGPVLLALMFVARSGSAITAEVGGMKISNQLDTLTVMSVSPFSFIFIPRILSAIFFSPLLLIISAIIGILGSILICYLLFDFPIYLFFVLLNEAFTWEALRIGLIKIEIFLIVSTIISCYSGYYVKDGAVGIGTATINSVVFSCIAILFFNLVITFIMNV